MLCRAQSSRTDPDDDVVDVVDVDDVTLSSALVVVEIKMLCRVLLLWTHVVFTLIVAQLYFKGPCKVTRV